MRRFAASLIDSLIVLPITMAVVYAQGFSQQLGILLAIPAAMVFAVYCILAHWWFGATLGKRLMKLKVVTEYAERSINFSHSLLRGLVYVLYALAMGYLQILAFQGISASEYLALEWYMRESLVEENMLDWHQKVQIIALVWFTISTLCLIVTGKKRALHDFIGGTVVVKTRNSYML
ncbi:hypothetical protein JCM19238_5549 [Vibrio ponticus]|nr:hypothetical protein JCM19238_5549 [Vibrio ponticus]